MRLHTGETQSQATPEWTWQQRQELGQKYLHDLSEDIIGWWMSRETQTKNQYQEIIQILKSNLELDGYTIRDSKLLIPESGILDVDEETNVLEALFTTLELQNKKTAFHHLNLSEEHYIANRWDDSISNSRKFFECVLREVASSHSRRFKQQPLPISIFKKPVKIREYLKKEGILEAKEEKAIASIYGLLSETGGHPYIAMNEQARLLRHMALTLSLFVMLRYQGFLDSLTTVT